MVLYAGACTIVCQIPVFAPGSSEVPVGFFSLFLSFVSRVCPNYCMYALIFSPIQFLHTLLLMERCVQVQALQQKIPCPRPISQCQKKEREGGRRKVITKNNNLSTYMYVLIGIVWHLSKLSSDCPDFYLIGKSRFSTHSSLCKFNYLKAQHLCHWRSRKIGERSRAEKASLDNG